MAENPIPSPLPADLPTNWTYGQTVAPAGAEAGLADQYGYNYLMAAVNAAQTAINLIGVAFESLPELDGGKIPISQLPAGVANGVASLDQTGKVPASQLPDMNYLPLAGGNMLGAINMGNYRITNLNTPADNQDAATKAYVDAVQAYVQNAGFSKLQTGSYTGTGAYGSGSPNTIIANFQPKFLFVRTNYSQGSTEIFWIEGLANTGSLYGNNNVSVSGNKVSWYTTDSFNQAVSQMNLNGRPYHWIILG